MTASLPAHVKANFSGEVRRRGADYQRRGLVSIESADSALIEATVRGQGGVYSLVLEHDGAGVGWACDCPAFVKWGPCKHLWALCLEISADQALRELLLAWLQSGDAGTTSPEFDEPDWPPWDDPDEAPGPWLPPARRGREPSPPRLQKSRSWQVRLDQLDRRLDDGAQVAAHGAGGRDVRFVLELEPSLRSDEVRVVVQERLDRRGRDGTHWRVVRGEGAMPTDATLAQAWALLRGAEQPPGLTWSGMVDGIVIDQRLAGSVLQTVAATGSLYWRRDVEVQGPLTLDEGSPWELRPSLEGRERQPGRAATVTLDAHLVRGDEDLACVDALWVHPAGLVIHDGCLGRLEAQGTGDLAWLVWSGGPLSVPAKRSGELMAQLSPRLGGVELAMKGAADVLPTIESLPMRPRLEVMSRRSRPPLIHLAFEYGDCVVLPDETDDEAFGRVSAHRYVARDREAEETARTTLAGWGARPESLWSRLRSTSIATKRLPELIQAALGAGWRVLVEGKERLGEATPSLRLSSGIDWFALEGGFQVGDELVELPAVIKAARSKAGFIELAGGATAELPEKWRKLLSTLTELGERHERGLKFRPSQSWFIDALLAAREGVEADAAFRKTRAALARFRAVRPKAPPRTFRGELRPYQREGLGWLQFLRRSSLGGCLADDMGLGKTVQVLALLEQLRPKATRPSLVVVPKSLLFNWKDEAARFAPRLRVHEHAGLGRKKRLEALEEADLVLTTYGTLRRDAKLLSEREFDVVVLDEAQAIKNSASQAAKAARLLRADQRLALSGTPIENHLGELWSIFEFLNPGMLGRSTTFRRLTSSRRSKTAEDMQLEDLSRAMAPFVLRRRKEDVLDDLPEKEEQILRCRLEGEQARDYEAARRHYQATFAMGGGSESAFAPDAEGERGSGLDVLSALLRLRQLACHRGLIDKSYREESSAKLEVLMSRLEEVIEAGHSALVFSQFTSWLGIVRARLKARGLVHEYLDGRTRDRKGKVERFQSDERCRLFLISLKAGGVGLNLTKATYVFLLDPWWNPAAERQAIDRTHRIGQTRPVTAYRLIASDTIEERVLELQATKAKLAEALFAGDRSALSQLTRDDLAHLLS